MLSFCLNDISRHPVSNSPSCVACSSCSFENDMVKKCIFYGKKSNIWSEEEKSNLFIFAHLEFCCEEEWKKCGNACVLSSSIVFKDLLLFFLIQNTAAYSKMQIWVEQSYWAKTQQQIHEKHTATYCHIFMDVVPSYAEISFVNFIRVSFLTY